MARQLTRLLVVARWRPGRVGSTSSSAPSRRTWASTSAPRQRRPPKAPGRAKTKATVDPHELMAAMSPDELDRFQSMTPEDQQQFWSEVEASGNALDNPEVQGMVNAEISRLAYELEHELPEIPKSREKVVPGIMSMGEIDEDGSGNDDDFNGDDDISSTAHGELDKQRELREYARIAAWEMPLLSKYAKPFEPPGEDRPLRFRYTTYLGEEHPAEKKIVVEFCVQDLPDLTDVQRDKFIKLVGVRYNPETDIVKMSCEMFEAQAQNKRYLGDLVNTLLNEARDDTDTFEDVPFDFRHHKFRPKPEFPVQWRMTPDRRAYLESSRQQTLLLGKERNKSGKLLDGLSQIENARAMSPVISPMVTNLASSLRAGTWKKENKSSARGYR